jgi:hypothetical protein
MQLSPALGVAVLSLRVVAPALQIDTLRQIAPPPAPPVSGSLLLVLPDGDAQVTLTLTGTSPGGLLATSATVAVSAHRQAEVTMQLDRAAVDGGTDGKIDGALDAAGDAAQPADAAPDLATPLLANGAPCSAPAQCASAVCAQGFCCATDCAGPCSSCALSLQEGTCLPIVQGGPPIAPGCPTSSKGSCGTDGNCDGNGNCELWPFGTFCANPVCMVDHITAYSCNGAGQCISGVGPCAPYRCDPASGLCYTSCTSSAQCTGTALCNISVCQ